MKETEANQTDKCVESWWQHHYLKDCESEETKSFLRTFVKEWRNHLGMIRARCVENDG